ncbi:DUF3830 family protein [Sphingomonas baiyangensis]|uniref:DUF3830 family protein n=1 Tax=Sphingomonas baiyangensis TaxID=2572576 RepID=A0A4U1L4F9_9SPHN|nr:DUF3830 family protein [Sphingomonas baiyangensis]TKD51093.1 DUF3830 family protein [Sphingomonas baiyangensis]
MRHIRLSEPRSGLSARCELLEAQAPLSCAFLRALAERRASFGAVHAMWTGPEISIPMPAASLPDALAEQLIAEENATAYPECGDVVLASLAAGSIKGLPPGNFFDVGLFYGGGGRLLMPFGWLRANVAARIVNDDLAKAQADCRTIRANGACTITIEPAP